MKKNFLAGLTDAEFLRRHWQKKPLLARDALNGHVSAITRDRLFALAGREDVESRIVRRVRSRWHVRDGPFKPGELRRLPASGWTLLVQGADLVVPQAARLLREFSFIPYARFDDIMVSYAAPGGGVGPHFDNYDVFLVQGQGERRWRVSAQRDLDLVADAPLRILRNFNSDQEWTLARGDVLYLPPRYAHEGVAVRECITWSVGFRAPAAQELGSRFLDFQHDRLALEGLYADPELKPVRRPARIPPAMLKHAMGVLERLRWSNADVAEFTGRFLTEPKPHVVFARPRRPLARPAFIRALARAGARLAPATRMLFHGRRIFMNGEASMPGAATARVAARLADARELRPHAALPADARELLYAWYLAGYIQIH
jgi:50S ribosomal protein L16 3-hydroxylase